MTLSTDHPSPTVDSSTLLGWYEEMAVIRGTELVQDSGGTISLAPQVEVQMGHGWPPVLKAINHGLRPSLSIDVVTTPGTGTT